MTKRYRIVIQHEIFIYNATIQGAKTIAVSRYTKAKCISIQEVALPEDEERQPAIDKRTAPGS